MHLVKKQKPSFAEQLVVGISEASCCISVPFPPPGYHPLLCCHVQNGPAFQTCCGTCLAPGGTAHRLPVPICSQQVSLGSLQSQSAFPLPSLLTPGPAIQTGHSHRRSGHSQDLPHPRMALPNSPPTADPHTVPLGMFPPSPWDQHLPKSS